MYDAAPSDAAAHDEGDGFLREKRWVQTVLPMMRAGKGEARTDVERCIVFLTQRLIPGSNGAPPEAIGQWLGRAMTVVGVVTDSEEDGKGINDKARDRLKSYGLRVAMVEQGKNGWKPAGEPLPNEEGWNTGYLLVAYGTCAPLAELFRDKAGMEWMNGNWIQSLAKIDNVRRGPAMKARFGGSPENCIAVPLTAFWSWGER